MLNSLGFYFLAQVFVLRAVVQLFGPDGFTLKNKQQ